MYTGIITDIGRVRSLEERGDRRMVIETGYDSSGITIGASIACSGVCLTVTDKGRDSADWFAVDASAETLRCTTLGDWAAETPVNLERSLKVGEELGGHIVTGHVDGVGRLVAREAEGDSQKMTFRAEAPLASYIAPKGSIAINGVSLTVNQVDDAVDAVGFSVNIIPHTLEKTNLGGLTTGDPVNLEIDILARYVARLKG